MLFDGVKQEALARKKYMYTLKLGSFFLFLCSKCLQLHLEAISFPARNPLGFSSLHAQSERALRVVYGNIFTPNDTVVKPLCKRACSFFLTDRREHPLHRSTFPKMRFVLLPSKWAERAAIATRGFDRMKCGVSKIRGYVDSSERTGIIWYARSTHLDGLEGPL